MCPDGILQFLDNRFEVPLRPEPGLLSSWGLRDTIIANKSKSKMCRVFLLIGVSNFYICVEVLVVFHQIDNCSLPVFASDTLMWRLEICLASLLSQFRSPSEFFVGRSSKLGWAKCMWWLCLRCQPSPSCSRPWKGNRFTCSEVVLRSLLDRYGWLSFIWSCCCWTRF